MVREASQYAEELYKTSPPPFGHPMLKFFSFDPQYTNLNNGSYGALPTPVRKFCDDLTTEIEANPDRFYRIYAPARMREARARIAKMIGAETEECVFVMNTTMGVTTVLRNFEWNKEDIIVKTSIAYGSIAQGIKYLCDTHLYPNVSTFELQFPISRSEIVNNFRAHVQYLLAGRPEYQRTGKIVIVIDAIASNPGISLPWKEMVSICKEFGIWTVVDGAHSIGQEMDINLSEVQPDFWVANCHKWLYAKRSCAVLYVPKRNQHVILSPIPTPETYPSPLDSHYSGPGSFEELFECREIDYGLGPLAECHRRQDFRCSIMGATPNIHSFKALDFRGWIGGEQKINEYTHALAIAGGERLASLLQTSVMDPTGEHTLSMVNVELPIPGDIKLTPELKAFFQETILTQWNTYAPPFYHNGKWWARCSAQIWNEPSDFELVAEVLRRMSVAVVEYAENLKQKAV